MQPATARNARPAYVPLRAGSPVLLHRNACVQLRSRYAECRHCERICPASALQLGEGAMSLGQGCIGCGRCMAACPTGALQVRGFFPTLELQAKPAPVRIDCARAPQGADIRVPCLGGLSLSRLLAMRLAAGERELELLDRGWCADCPAAAGAKEHPAAKSLSRAQARLRDAGMPERLLPRLAAAPLALAKRAPEKAVAPNLARRSVMGAFTRPLQAALEAPERRFAPAPAPERERVLGVLVKLAARYGGQVSQKLFHTVEVSASACQGHGVCAAGCPTGALRAHSAEGAARGLSHSSALCIGCGHCERVCPEQAVRVVFGGGDAHGERRLVATFESCVCEACGTPLAVTSARRGSRTVCERCAKSSALARAAFQQFHGSRAVDGI